MNRKQSIQLMKKTEQLIKQKPASKRVSVDYAKNIINQQFKDVIRMQLKSTSDSSKSSISQQLTDKATVQTRVSQQSQFNIDVCFDSLEPYYRSKEQAQTVKKLTSLQNIFILIKQLNAIQQNRSNLKQLSGIQNQLLILEREFIANYR